MAFSSKVLWSEGMLLQPQHLQQQERYWNYMVTQRPQVLEAYNWGITDLKIDLPLLTLGKFSILSARGILPDGTAFNIPAHDDAPIPIDIPAGVAQCKIYLALSLKDISLPASFTEHNLLDTKPRHRGESLDVVDNNAGVNFSAAVQIGKLYFNLLLATDDRQGFSCLAIARVAECRTSQPLILDEDFIPACLNVQALPHFASLITEVHGLLQYRGNILVERLIGGAANSVAEITDFMLLQIINRFEPLLTHYSNIKGIHPEQLYRLLIELMAELSTFTSTRRRPIAAPQYQHDDLSGVFKPVIAEIRRALSQVLEESAVALKLLEQSGNVWLATIADKELFTTAQFILAVHAHTPTDQLHSLLPAHIKIASSADIRNLVNRALPGIDLQPLMVAPRQIPYHANFSYFILNKDHPLWQSLQVSAAIAFHVSGSFPGLALQLWAVKDK